MLSLIANRILRIAIVLVIVSFFTLIMVNMLPGGPAAGVIGENATPEMVKQINAQYGYDDPIPQRYARWIGDLLRGDFGTSLKSGKTVVAEVKQRFPVTLELALGAQVIALLLAVTLALLAAPRAGRLFDRTATTAMSALTAIPSFLGSYVLAYLFAVKLRWVPVIGWIPLTESAVLNLKSAILPMTALALPEIAAYQRVLRNDVLATLQEDFIVAARAKGLPSRRIMLRHALRPSSFSVVTLAGVNLGRLLGGAVIVEFIFGLPGLGFLIFNSVQQRDVPLMQGLVVFVAMLYLLLNLGVEVIYGFIDPRVRAKAAA